MIEMKGRSEELFEGQEPMTRCRAPREREPYKPQRRRKTQGSCGHGAQRRCAPTGLSEAVLGDDFFGVLVDDGEGGVLGWEFKS